MLGTARGSHVRLLQGYCPLCFKGRIGFSTSVCFPRGDPCIDDELQGLFGGNGLAMLDLETPGERCEHTKMCRVVCVVCAGSMADGDDVERFSRLVDALDRFEEEESELDGELGTGPLQFLAARMQEDARANRQKTLRKFGLTWLDRLGKPVHLGCAKETPCGCVVDKGAVRCFAHDVRLKSKVVVVTAPAKVATTMMGGESNKKMELESRIFKAPEGGGAWRRAITVKRATWLDPPTKLAAEMTITEPHPTTVQQRIKKARPAAKVKPNVRLEEAAKCTAYKINEWTSGKEGATQAAGKSDPTVKKRYDMGKHHQDFDMWTHGRFLRDGLWWYRRPDGVVVAANEGVAYFDEEGQLVPC